VSFHPKCSSLMIDLHIFSFRFCSQRRCSLLSRQHPKGSQLCGVCEQLRSWEGPQRAQNLEVFPIPIRRHREAPASKLNKNNTNFRTMLNYCIKSNYQIRNVLLQTQEGCKGLALCIPSSQARYHPALYHLLYNL
jgi:hypothetical protein